MDTDVKIYNSLWSISRANPAPCPTESVERSTSRSLDNGLSDDGQENDYRPSADQGEQLS
jgi:hypothetical protein